MQPQVRSGAARGWTWADCTYLKSCSKKNCSLVSITFPPPIKMILITPINASAWEKHAHFHQWLTLQEIRPYQLCNNETCSSATQLTFLTKLSGGKCGVNDFASPSCFMMQFGLSLFSCFISALSIERINVAFGVFRYYSEITGTLWAVFHARQPTTDIHSDIFSALWPKPFLWFVPRVIWCLLVLFISLQFLK